jgi:ATP-binding cassette subfamily B protein/ATP-binding cassette subfamily C protein
MAGETRLGQYSPSLSFAWKYLRQHMLGVSVLSAVLVGSTLVQLATPVIIRNFVDAHTGGTASPSSAMSYAASFVVVAIAGHGLSILEAAVAADVGWRATNRLRADLLRHCLRLPMSYHTHATPGSLVERVDGDSAVLSNFFSRFVVLTVGESLYAIGLVCAITAVDWRVGGVFAAITVAALLVLRPAGRLGRVAASRYRAAMGNAVGGADEHSVMRADIVANGAYAYARRQFERLMRRLRRADLRSSLLSSSLLWCISSFAVGAAAVAALAVSASLVLSGRMEIGAAFLVFTYTQQLIWPLDQLSQQIRDFQLAMAALGRSQELLALPVEPDGAAPVPAGAVRSGRHGDAAVRLDDVWHSYGDTSVLCGVSLTIAPGGVVGVVGRTGSGKSTVARLVAGLYPVERGRMTLGGEDAAVLGLREIRRRVTLVTQEVELLRASVRDNVRLFDESASDADILKALELLGLTSWLDAQADGLDTVIDPERPAMSGGEMQLLAMARVLLRDPDVVVLDEAASRLDARSEAAMNVGLERLLDGRRSALMVAHRLSSLRHVEEVLVMADGQVVESGPRDELAAAGGMFTSLIVANGADPAILDRLWGRVVT